MDLNNLFNRMWYEDHPAFFAFLPFSWLYKLAIKFRLLLYVSGFYSINYVSVPVIVVGNITIGGTGKTPFVIWLSEYLVIKGFKPGIISRGYKGKSGARVQQVRADSDPEFVGDEPVLLAKRTGRPVAISADKYEAAKQLVELADCDILICDDGLQHLALNRDLEIAMIDGDRKFGNNHLLPAGPLREPISRLSTVDMLVSNGNQYKNTYLMNYEYGDLTLIADESKKTHISRFHEKQIHLVSGIANPDRFHDYFKQHNVNVLHHVFPDHHHFSPQDLAFGDDKPVVMTEKDAIKCVKFASDNFWYLPVQARFDEIFYHRINTLLREKINGQKIA